MIKNHVTKNCTEYKPVNLDKYHGKLPVICRSSWEFSFARWCDHNSHIVSWSSESVEVRYQDPISPIDRRGKPRIRRYYPDFLICTDKGEWFLIEIKPAKEVRPPKRTKSKASKTILHEEKTYIMNSAKWKAAENLCRRKGWTFKKVTENELFGGNR